MHQNMHRRQTDCCGKPAKENNELGSMMISRIDIFTSHTLD